MTTAMEKAQGHLDKRSGRSNATTIRDMLESQQTAIARALPKHMDPDRMVKMAWGVISRDPKLLQCEAASLVRAVIQAAELGLEPSNGLGHCYLLPYGKQAQLIIGYRGFIELAARGGQARFRPARVVYDCDHFVWKDGLEQKLEHTPGERQKGSRPTHVYCVVDFANGLPSMPEVMTIAEVERIRQSSPGKNSGAWRDHFDEMAKKTVVRRLAKFTPLSPQLQRAAAEDEHREYGDVIEVDFALNEEVDPETGEVTEGPPLEGE